MKSFQMKLHPFVFSNKQNYRLSRHILFWFVYILYESISSAIIMWKTFGFARSFIASFIEIVETASIDICFCYFIIYYLFPQFLYKGKYISMLFLWLFASIVGVSLYELNAFLISPHIRSAFGLPTGEKMFKDFWGFSNLSTLFSLFTQLNMEGCVTASIKLGKLRFIKQQEIDLLKQEKNKTQQPEEHNIVQPAFLTDLLKRMEIIANENPVLAAQSIRKIHKLLLYVLYENSASQVSLQKELVLLQEYIDLEKITAQQNIQITTSIENVADTETIAPSVLMPLAENAFKQVAVHHLKHASVSIDIKLNQGMLCVQINWSKPVATSSLLNGGNVILHNVLKRLKLIYPQSHELKLKIEAESVTVTLRLNLKKAIN